MGKRKQSETERYIHFSDGPLGKINSVPQAPAPTLGMKPRGLWFSVEDEALGEANCGWKRWATSENFQVERLRNASELIFHADARLLRLGSRWGISKLTRRYLAHDHPANNLPMPIRHNFALDWASLANDYQGIVIAPYVWECRLLDWCFWYYSWDCASGCVWDASAIKKVRPAPEFVEEASV